EYEQHRALGITAADALTIAYKAVSRPGQGLPRQVGIAEAHPVVEPVGMLALQWRFRRPEGDYAVVGFIRGGQLGQHHVPLPPVILRLDPATGTGGIPGLGIPLLATARAALQQTEAPDLP